MGLATPYQTLAIGRVVNTLGVASVVWQDGSFVDLTVTVLPFSVFHPSAGVYNFTLDQAADPVKPGTALFATCEGGAGAFTVTMTQTSDTTFTVRTWLGLALTDADFSFEIRVAPTTNN
jgi:hypothetical protein